MAQAKNQDFLGTHEKTKSFLGVHEIKHRFYFRTENIHFLVPEALLLRTILGVNN